VLYTHWQSGVPDDRDDRENHDEQCAKIQSDGTWDDVACSATTGFLCER
jgi:Lectin C-type domain